MAETWLARQARKEADRDRVSLGDVIGQIVGVIIALAVALYFTALYNLNTGFFTDQFTAFDAVLFFGIAYLGVIPGLAKVILHSKNAGRPLEAVMQVFILAAALLFLSSFPFDFAHLADALPASLQPIISWITNDIARMLLVLMALVSLFTIPWTVVQYLGVRKVLQERKGSH
jgi:hypothetical protein